MSGETGTEIEQEIDEGLTEGQRIQRLEENFRALRSEMHLVKKAVGDSDEGLDKGVDVLRQFLAIRYGQLLQQHPITDAAIKAIKNLEGIIHGFRTQIPAALDQLRDRRSQCFCEDVKECEGQKRCERLTQLLIYVDQTR